MAKTAMISKALLYTDQTNSNLNINRFRFLGVLNVETVRYRKTDTYSQLQKICNFDNSKHLQIRECGSTS